MKERKIKLVKTLLAFMIIIAAVLPLSACSDTKSEPKHFKTLDDLQGCTFAISDSNISYQTQISAELQGAKFDKYTNYFDTFIAVANGNADAALSFKYTFIGIKESYPDLKYIESSFKIPIVANFSSSADKLREDFNNFIVEAAESGLLDKLAEKWLYNYDKLSDDDIIDFDTLDSKNGSFFVGTCNDNIPYEYLRNGELIGYEPALLYEFCKARGYAPEIIESNYSAVVAGVAAGKYDMAFGAYGYTDERSENSNFSSPYFLDTVVYTINDAKGSFDIFNEIKAGFERSFIAQNRWKLFVTGIFVTLFIAVMSVVIGSGLGFVLFIISRRKKWLMNLSYEINNVLEALPILVVLMVFFYIIFGSANVSGVMVSIIVFGLSFTFTFFALISNSVRAIPPEQTEAGLALGYTEKQTLFKIVLPQAMESFIPSIRSAIVATLKSTAIVGYVAVEDLTKVGDLIRSQTFDAFFPIITVALLYFLIAKFLIFLLGKILVTPGEKRRMKKEGK